MGRGRVILIATLAGLAAGTGLMADDRLPVRDVTLYRSGVGSFVRSGLVDGAERVTIRFKTDDINDILKSMVLLDLGGGAIDAVSYSSREPLERRLASFAVDISDNPGIAELLSRLRGASVSLTTTDGPVRGTVLGVERRPRAVGDHVVQAPFVNLLTTSGIRSIDLLSAHDMQILDRELAEELGRALAAVAEHRAERVKAVELGFRGDGSREVVVVYTHEMPVWKTSYRLILPDDSAGGQATIQGWAIVENTTDEDWKNVTLSLVAGQPVSFRMDLYEPLFVPRPLIPVPVLAAILPQVYRAGIEARSARRSDAAPVPQMVMDPMHELRERALSDSLDRFTRDSMVGSAAAAMAGVVQIGEVFQYQISTPVSIQRQQSAMIPLLTGALEGRRVSIFDRAHNRPHPMRGVELTNTTDMQLIPGPISVYDGTAYAGDAQVGHVSAGEKRLISYALDLEVEVRAEDSRTSRVESVTISRGSLVRTSKSTMAMNYTVINKDQSQGRTVIIEHAKTPGWDLISPRRPTEETETHLRFEVEAAPGETVRLVVEQERIDRQTLAMGSIGIDQLVAYSRDGRVSQRVLDAVQRAVSLHAAVREMEQRVGELEAERTEIGRDQARVRQNMQTIDQSSSLYRRYMTRLDEQETRLDEIAAALGIASAERARRQQALDDYLRDLTVD